MGWSAGRPSALSSNTVFLPGLCGLTWTLVRAISVQLAKVSRGQWELFVGSGVQQSGVRQALGDGRVVGV